MLWRQRLVLLLMVISGALVPPVGLAQLGPQVELLEAFQERWNWESYWGQGFEKLSYTAGEVVDLGLFLTPDVTGYCSVQLSACMSYELRDGSLGPSSEFRSVPPSENLEQALAEFIRAVFSPSQPQPRSNLDNGRNHRVSADLRSAAATRAGDHPATTKPVNPRIRQWTVKATLPELLLPRAIRLKIEPPSYRSLKSKLLQFLKRGEDSVAADYQFVVPFFSDADPRVYVLERESGVASAVLILVRDERGDWLMGGHYDRQIGRGQLDMLTPLILAAEMDILGQSTAPARRR